MYTVRQYDRAGTDVQVFSGRLPLQRDNTMDTKPLLRPHPRPGPV